MFLVIILCILNIHLLTKASDFLIYTKTKCVAGECEEPSNTDNEWYDLVDKDLEVRINVVFELLSEPKKLSQNQRMYHLGGYKLGMF